MYIGGDVWVCLSLNKYKHIDNNRPLLVTTQKLNVVTGHYVFISIKVIFFSHICVALVFFS